MESTNQLRGQQEWTAFIHYGLGILLTIGAYSCLGTTVIVIVVADCLAAGILPQGTLPFPQMKYYTRVNEAWNRHLYGCVLGRNAIRFPGGRGFQSSCHCDTRHDVARAEHRTIYYIASCSRSFSIWRLGDLGMQHVVAHRPLCSSS